jgi:hypothetical protein
MDEKGVLQRIVTDLKDAPLQKVIYLEGKTDVGPFFSLLGVVPVAARDGGRHQGVYVRGLAQEASGRTAVADHVRVAERHHILGVFGVVDGDGRPLSDLVPLFEAPSAGPLFTWKAYCIENLLAKTGWPPAWGTAPDWPVALDDYGPYVALNRIFVELQSILEVLSVAKRIKPISGQPLMTAREVLTNLNRDRHRLLGYDVAQRFQDELQVFQTALQGQPDEAHTMLNGKWLFSHLAPVRTGHNPDRCKADWIAHAISVGGLAEVRDLWQRITGAAP